MEGVRRWSFLAIILILAALVLLGHELVDLRRSASQMLASQQRLEAQLRILGTERAKAPAIPQGRARVRIFWHHAGLTHEDAGVLALTLQNKGFVTEVRPHRNPRSPDAVFIGALVSADDVRAVLPSLPYKVEYVFRLDYPEASGGDPEGRSIGVGYTSSLPTSSADQKQVARRISAQQLSSLLEPGLSSTEFQLRLRSIAGP